MDRWRETTGYEPFDFVKSATLRTDTHPGSIDSRGVQAAIGWKCNGEEAIYI